MQYVRLMLAIAFAVLLSQSVVGADLPPGKVAGDRRLVEIKGQQVALRWCPPGTFNMGSPASEPERVKDEPLHEVTLTQGFWMMETEVTQSLWTAVAGKIEAKFKGSDQPAEPVTWYDAVEFCNKLSTECGLTPAYQINKEARDQGNLLADKDDSLKWQVSVIPGATGFRLPTEAQWEYACRAGTATAFSFGDVINPSLANYNGTNVYNNGEKGPYLMKTTPVGSYAANPWGLRDIHGNVWEWCWDWYGEYPAGKATDPAGPSQGSARVLRGGCWHYKPAYLRSAARFKDKPAKKWDLLGIRLVLPSKAAER